MENLVEGPWFMIHRKLTIFFVLLFLLLLLAVSNPPSNTYAFTINQPEGYGIQVGEANADTILQTVIGNAIKVVFALAAILIIFFLIWGAIDWVMSGGDKEKVGNARKKITSALIGLALLAFVFVIASVLGRIVGFDPLGPLPIPSLGAT